MQSRHLLTNFGTSVLSGDSPHNVEGDVAHATTTEDRHHRLVCHLKWLGIKHIKRAPHFGCSFLFYLSLLIYNSSYYEIAVWVAPIPAALWPSSVSIFHSQGHGIGPRTTTSMSQGYERPPLAEVYAVLAILGCIRRLPVVWRGCPAIARSAHPGETHHQPAGTGTINVTALSTPPGGRQWAEASVNRSPGGLPAPGQTQRELSLQAPATHARAGAAGQHFLLSLSATETGSPVLAQMHAGNLSADPLDCP